MPWMTGLLTELRAVRALILLVAALSFGLAQAREGLILVGVGLPRSGALADFGADYERGLQLWQEELNAAGGLIGQKVELRIVDDSSDGSRAGAIYEALLREQKVDLLIGPYGSAATLGAAAVAERARRVMLNAAGASRAVHRRGPEFVFQVTAPYAAYGIGPVELAGAGKRRSVFIVSRDESVSREMAEAAREAALRRGLRVGEVVFFRPGTEDFSLLLAEARDAGADAWLAFATHREAAELVKAFRKLEYAPALFFARDASDPRFIDLVGQDAEYTLGLAEYQPAWRTPGNAAFVEAFRAKWSADPGFAAAQAHAAGTVLAEAVRRAGGIDQEKLRGVLSALQTPTVLGGYQVDPASGEQLAAKPAVVQIIKGRREVVWPSAVATQTPPLPYAPWSERQLLK